MSNKNEEAPAKNAFLFPLIKIKASPIKPNVKPKNNK